MSRKYYFPFSSLKKYIKINALKTLGSDSKTLSFDFIIVIRNYDLTMVSFRWNLGLFCKFVFYKDSSKYQNLVFRNLVTESKECFVSESFEFQFILRRWFQRLMTIPFSKHNSFSRNFQSNCSSELLWMAGFKKVRKKVSPSNTRKTFKNKKKCSNMFYRMDRLNKRLKKIRAKCRSPVSITLPYDFIKTGLHRRYFPRNVPILFQDNRFIKQVLVTASNASLFV